MNTRHPGAEDAFSAHPAETGDTHARTRARGCIASASDIRHIPSRWQAPRLRISEAVTAQAAHLDFVEAARASGAATFKILYYHILNNVLGPILVYATSLISVGIILAAGLSFLGLGVNPPSPEWGLMLNNLRQALWVDPVIAALPGVMIFITSMCFNLLSDGLRQAMDVRL